MSPHEAEAHAKSAKRQFEVLGIGSDVEVEEFRDLAAERDALRSFPATVGDIEDLVAEINELKKILVVSLKATNNVNVSFSGRIADDFWRSQYQKITKSIQSIR